MIKKVRRYLIIALLFFMTATLGLADAPPDPGEDPTGGGTPVGGGSPIGGGFLITLALAAVYGTRKAINFKKK